MRMVKRGSLILLSMVLILACSVTAFGFGANKFEEELKNEQSAIKLVREIERGDYRIVGTEELKQWVDGGKDILIVDTMPYDASYKKEHVPGAVQFLFPIPEMETWDSKETDNKTQDDYLALLGADKKRVIVIYCGFVKCTRSHNGAMWAKRLGYESVYRYPGGIFAWKGADYETEAAQD